MNLKSSILAAILAPLAATACNPNVVLSAHATAGTAGSSGSGGSGGTGSSGSSGSSGTSGSTGSSAGAAGSSVTPEPSQCLVGPCRCPAQITAAGYTTCAVNADGSASCWGSNEYGQVGDGTTAAAVAPVALSTLSPIASITPAESHTCAILQDGTVSCWGLNTHGKLGNGSLVDENQPLPAPVAPFGASPTRSLAVGLHHTCARDSDDQVWCWGNNGGGQLGDGTWPGGESIPSPIKATAVPPMSAIAAGPNDTCGIALDATVWCWGHNGEVPIGDGSTAKNHPQPVQVSGLDNVVEIAMSVWHSCARKSDGTAWCWGRNYGWIGDGTIGEEKPFPVQVSGLTDVAEIDIGLHFSCARKSDGTVWCWGDNYSGQLAAPPAEAPTPVPVQIAGLSHPAVQIAAGREHVCARLVDESVWCWGGLVSGADGEAITAPTPTPSNVPLLCP